MHRRSPRKYGSPIFDSLLVSMTCAMENFTGLDLDPTYSYVRLYKNGDALERHTDRVECEISVSVCLGYDISNLSDPTYKWPLSFEHDGKTVDLKLNIGDGVIYKGIELPHWRDKFLGNNQGQAFLHYVNKNGYHKDRVLDGRSQLGTPPVPT